MDVSEIMTLEVISVKKDAPLKEAAGLLAKLRIHGMPVIDGENKVVGVITESDFFSKDASNIYLPTFLDFIKGEPNEAKIGNDNADLDQTTKVADIMTEKCLTVKPDLSVKELIKIFKETSFKTIPVADEGGVLVGIVTVMDVIKLL